MAKWSGNILYGYLQLHVIVGNVFFFISACSFAETYISISIFLVPFHVSGPIYQEESPLVTKWWLEWDSTQLATGEVKVERVRTKRNKAVTSQRVNLIKACIKHTEHSKQHSTKKWLSLRLWVWWRLQYKGRNELQTTKKEVKKSKEGKRRCVTAAKILFLSLKIDHFTACFSLRVNRCCR